MKTYIKNYPRPQLVRRNWQNLDGAWDFAFDDDDRGESSGYPGGFEKQKTILVPFTYETEMSGIHDPARHDHIWYQRRVEMHPETGKRILIHFEGSDYRTRVWVNGRFVGEHEGGYARFTFDITNAIVDGSNLIVVKADDSFALTQPRGKQRWQNENFACWYVQTTGIWKTVWLESVPETYIRSLKLTPDIHRLELEIESDVAGAEEPGRNLAMTAKVSFEGHEIATLTGSLTSAQTPLRISVARPDETAAGVHLWSPESPALYDLEVTVTENGKCLDTVYSYFGMREIRIDKGNILLNGHPLYQRLILDQGYWKESGLTAPSEDALVTDIDRIHELGFNGLRKHMKVEDERFLYWCDVKGMLVWSEMAATYQFSDKAVRNFTKEWMEVVAQNYSHPSIITWTPFNESWGVPDVETDRTQQHFTEAIYHLTKCFDPMRPVIVNDGWEHTVSDIITLHDYEEDGGTFLERYLTHKDEIMSTELYHCRGKSAMANGFRYRGQPVIISEYGGIAFRKRGEGEWGYGHGVADEEDFLRRYDRITTAIRKIPWICGFCYTQVSDVEQEVNGLMTADREYKVNPGKIAEVNTRETAFHA